MFSGLWRIVNRVVAATVDGFMKSASFLILLLGVVCIGVSHLFVKESAYPNWHNFIISVGSLLVSAGVFAILLKSFQYIGVFRAELLKMFEDEGFEKILRRVLHDEHHDDESRLRTLQVLMKQILIGITPEVAVGVVKNTINRIRMGSTYDGYYRIYNRVIRIESYSKEGRVVTLKDEVFIELVPSSPSILIPYEPIVHGNAGTTKGQLTVNGQDLSDQIRFEEGDARYKIPLQGSQSYRIDRQYKRTFSLPMDPYIHLALSRHALTMQISVENEVAHHIGVIIRPCGFNPRDTDMRWSETQKDISDARDGSKQKISVAKQSLTFPWQGYIIVLYEK